VHIAIDVPNFVINGLVGHEMLDAEVVMVLIGYEGRLANINVAPNKG
jgi:hypothetical protein